MALCNACLNGRCYLQSFGGFPSFYYDLQRRESGMSVLLLLLVEEEEEEGQQQRV
jgi:hypothetical protein